MGSGRLLRVRAEQRWGCFSGAGEFFISRGMQADPRRSSSASSHRAEWSFLSIRVCLVRKPRAAYTRDHAYTCLVYTRQGRGVQRSGASCGGASPEGRVR